MSTINVKQTGDWAKAEALLSAAPARFNEAIEVALQGEAEFLRGKMVGRFGRGGGGKFSAQAVTTKATGGRGKPLVRTGELRNSIGVVDGPGDHSKFIGVPAQSGDRNVRLADIHENGRTIVQAMTPAQRRYLHAVLPPGGGKGGGTGIIVSHIPARPFVQPTFDAEAPKIPARFVKRMADALGGDYGSA